MLVCVRLSVHVGLARSIKDLLGGFVVGASLVWCLHMVNSTILVDQPVKYVQQGSELQPFIIDSTEKVYADAPAESTADDLDSDGKPNDWESSNGLNPADASDAVSDFDSDG